MNKNAKKLVQWAKDNCPNFNEYVRRIREGRILGREDPNLTLATAMRLQVEGKEYEARILMAAHMVVAENESGADGRSKKAQAKKS